MGHGANTITRMPDAIRGIEKLDLVVVCDPYPTAWSVLSQRRNDMYSAAGLYQLRDGRFAYRVEPLDPMGRANCEAGFSNRRMTTT